MIPCEAGFQITNPARDESAFLPKAAGFTQRTARSIADLLNRDLASRVS